MQGNARMASGRTGGGAGSDTMDPSLTFSRIVVWGGGIFAPAVTVWFRTLERIPIRAKWPGAIARMSLDQFLFAPFVLTGECRLRGLGRHS